MTTWLERWETAGEGPRLAVKDCIDVGGTVTTAGCPVIAERARRAPQDAPVVAAARKAGARIVGKTNLSELCWSAAGTNRWSGNPVNPIAPDRVPGGSSSGSAVAVARREADIALGTDTTGSVRVPAACCGVAGLKTTFGRIPLDGVHPLAPSLDTVGWLGLDLAAIEAGMRLAEPGFTVPGSIQARAGRLRPEGVAPEIDAAIDEALAASGIRMSETQTVDFIAATEQAAALVDAEGYRSNEHLMSDIGWLDPDSQLRMRAGRAIGVAALNAARQAGKSLRGTFDALLSEFRFLVLPVLCGPPPLLGQRGIPLTYLTAPVNLAGLPALAIPLHDTRYPMAVQVIGPANSEEELITFGRVIERAMTGC